MSQTFIPVQWNRQKRIYDMLLAGIIIAYMVIFVGVGLWVRAADIYILILRALGTCAFVLLHVILSIGPLARLNDRIKPVLYNRRHFGVMMALLGLAHGVFALVWYHGDGVLNPLVSALGGYGDYGQAIQFPFESLGFLALLILLVMAASSHDFWLAWLTPPVWKALHMGVYLAYVLLVGHVVLGVAQFDDGIAILVAVGIGALWLCGLHFTALLASKRLDKTIIGNSLMQEGNLWYCVGNPLDIPMNKAQTILPQKGERIAVFRHAKGFSAIMGVCAHQNGPLGEGCIIDGLVTCPWHGFQFDPETGAAPAPFTDKIPTHNLQIIEGQLWVQAHPNPLGERGALVCIDEDDSDKVDNDKGMA